jgi:hypothetical protein
MATDPVTFFVRIDLPQHFQLAEGTCLDNDKTEERLLTKTEVVNVAVWEDKLNVLLISRYPRTSTKKWIVANEKEVFNWDTRNSEDRNIRLNE